MHYNLEDELVVYWNPASYYLNLSTVISQRKDYGAINLQLVMILHAIYIV